MLASRYSNNCSTIETVRMILNHSNININLQNKKGWTALMIASRYSNNGSTIETVRMLLNHSNINVNLRNNDGWTASMLASKYSNGRINNSYICCPFYFW
jgi:ankyrin repeat protein